MTTSVKSNYQIVCGNFLFDNGLLTHAAIKSRRDLCPTDFLILSAIFSKTYLIFKFLVHILATFYELYVYSVLSIIVV